LKNFKVLSLDGGGIRGYLTILILEILEKTINEKLNEDKSIGERFDLIVGTSTGGIIASGLAIGKKASEIKPLYEKLIKKIFTPISKGYLKAKYNQETLRKEIQQILKDKTFNDVKTHLCLTSVDISTSKPRFFKSPYLDKYKSRADEKLIDAVLATSAAPIYFPLVDKKYSFFLADGGLIANNPSMIGITEAYQKTKDLKKIKLLSIGTGEMRYMPYDVKKIKNKGGVASWTINYSKTESFFRKKIVIPLIEVLLNSQSNLITSQARLLLQRNFLRINPILPTSIELDETDTDTLKILKNIALEADNEKTKKAVIKLLLKDNL